MGGVVGRLFREFAGTLSAAIGVSLLVSLSATPMMCAHLLRERVSHGWLYRVNDRIFHWILRQYGRTLNVVLRQPAVMLLILFGAIGLNIHLFVQTPKGFFPLQDGARLNGTIIADQDTSFQGMQSIVRQMVKVVQADDSVASLNGYVGGINGGGQGATTNTARIYITLKPLEERSVSADSALARLRPKLAAVPGASLYLQVQQDLRVGGRGSSAVFQFTLRTDNCKALGAFRPPMLRGMRRLSGVAH